MVINHLLNGMILQAVLFFTAQFDSQFLEVNSLFKSNLKDHFVFQTIPRGHVVNLANNNKANTPLETNMEPENGPLEKEIPIGNHHFQLPCEFFGVYLLTKKTQSLVMLQPSATCNLLG